jgi:hypothetical protein
MSNYLTDVPLRDRLLRVLDAAVERADLTLDEAFGLLATFDATQPASTHHDPEAQTHVVADPECALHQEWPTKPNPDARCEACRPEAQ